MAKEKHYGFLPPLSPSMRPADELLRSHATLFLNFTGLFFVEEVNYHRDQNIFVSKQ